MWLSIRIAAYCSIVLAYGLLLILAVHHRLERGSAQRWLERTLIAAGLWTLAVGLLDVVGSGWWWAFLWQRVAQVGLIALALLTSLFASVFAQRRTRLWLQVSLVAVLTVAAILVDTLPLGWPGYTVPVVGFRLGTVEVSMLLLGLAWFLPMLAAWRTALQALRQVSGSKHRNRIRYLLAALLGFAVGDLLVLSARVPDVQVGLAVRLLGFCIITFALLRYDLPDLRRLSLATVCFLLLSVLTAGLYAAILLALSYALGPVLGRSPWSILVPVVGLSLLLAAAIDVWLRPRLKRLLDRTILGQSYDVQKALQAYSQQINLILDVDRLADTTLDWLRTTLGVRHSAFVVFTRQGEAGVELRILRTTSSTPPGLLLFRADSRFVLHFVNQRRPLSQYDLDMLSWFQVMAGVERQWLKDLALDLYIPVLVAEEPVALLGLGARASGQPYSEEDLETLMTLAGQTGTALENARLLDDLRAVQDDLHRISSELGETNRQLQRLDQVKTDFITIASHELRTPLTQIYGYSDILTRMQEDDLSNAQVVHQFIEGITRGASRLKRVVDAMVDMSLVETGAMRIQPVTLPVGVVVQNAVETVQQAASQRGLTISVKDLSALPYIQADSARLEQVLVGLLSNAVKFTPDDGQITVSGRLDASAKGEYIELLVVDTGIGIDPDEQDLVFEKFHRSEDLLSHSTDDVAFKGAGPGLGLAIAKGLVEAHGGRLWVESPGRDEKRCPGSTFHVRLPVGGPPPQPVESLQRKKTR
jgi:signal transduction histidine kinase